jgi:alpha-1,3/alpha-1,6-mannosyltransferase
MLIGIYRDLLFLQVFGDFFPRSIMGRFHILFATVRGFYLALVIVLTQPRYDVLFVDQLSSPIPILRLCGSRIIFYCHFPDLALSGR